MMTVKKPPMTVLTSMVDGVITSCDSPLPMCGFPKIGDPNIVP